MKNEITSFNNPISSTTVTEQVYSKIKSAIVSGELQPGQRIVQEEITKQLAVSRTPVREALQRLSSEGLVTIKPFYGAMVFQVSLQELNEIYDIRIQIERYAIQKSYPLLGEDEIRTLEELNCKGRSCTENRMDLMDYDRQFHYLLCTKGVCDYIRQVLNGIWNQCDPYKSIYLANNMNIEKMISEHENIVACLKSKDIRGVDRAVTRHLDDVVDKIFAEKRNHTI